MRHSHRYIATCVSIASFATAVAVVGACSSASAPPEKAGRTSSALNVTKDFVIGQDTVTTAVQQAQRDNPSITIANGELNVSLPGLAVWPYNLKPIPPTPIPPISFTANGTSGTATCESFTLDPSSVTATFGAGGLQVTASGSGVFSLSTHAEGLPVNPTISVSATVTGLVTYNPTSNALGVPGDSLVATSSNISVTGCGVFGWCDAPVQEQIDVNNILQSYAAAPLNSFLSSASVTAALRSVMQEVAEVESPTPEDQTEWQYVQNSGYIGSTGLDYQESAVSYPAVTPPPNCTATRDCTNEYIYCDEVPSPVTQSVIGASLIASSVVLNQNAYTMAPGVYQVCDVDTYDDDSAACQTVAEPAAPLPSSCITCPVCLTGFVCEISGNSATCVPNHRCEVGYHYCGTACVKGTGACP